MNKTKYINRFLKHDVLNRLSNIPCVAILGPRQCGKTTLARSILEKEFPNSIYLDLESYRDLNKLSDPETFFEDNREKLICIDEIQRKPDLFFCLRSVIDKNKRNGQFLILGSASPTLIRQSSESLAGRISYLELTPFFIKETGLENINSLWLKGGFPLSFLTSDDQDSLEWRLDFIRTFLERDIPALGIDVSQKNIHRIWQMCANMSSQVLNYSQLAMSLGISVNTVKKYIDILVQTYMVRLVPPYEANIRKRIIKAPRIYVRDTGIMHALLFIKNKNTLMGHPVYGASWETFALENILAPLKNWQYFFLRNSTGNEIDLILVQGKTVLAVEFKASSSPKLEKGFFVLHDEIKPTESWIISPVKEKYTYSKEKNIIIGNPADFIEAIGE